MYNWVDNHDQLEEFERDLWYRDRNKPSTPTSQIEMLECVENPITGEWVPKESLEGRTATTSAF